MIPDLSIIIRDEVSKVQPTSTDLAPAAQHQIERIQARTASGVDYQGNPWPAGKHGIVTLGDLAESIEYEVDPGGITLAIAGEKGEIAEFQNNGTSRIPRRHFFDVSDRDLEAIAEEITDSLTRRS